MEPQDTKVWADRSQINTNPPRHAKDGWAKLMRSNDGSLTPDHVVNSLRSIWSYYRGEFYRYRNIDMNDIEGLLNLVPIRLYHCTPFVGDRTMAIIFR